MGKKTTSSNKKGGNQKQTAAAVCECADPYKCSCGKRPERPSRGHKWDPELKQWGGKGHKQKGVGASTSSKDVQNTPKVTKIGNTTIEHHQKLPSQILFEVCKKQGRPTPIFKPFKFQSQAKCRVIIQDAKVSKRNNSDNDLVFCPLAGCANAEQAKEESCILALLKLAPAIPHERRLPEPYKTTYLNAVKSTNSASKPTNSIVVEAKKEKPVENTLNTASNTSSAKASTNLLSQSKFNSVSERNSHEQTKRQNLKAKLAKQEALESANRDHIVFLSNSLRTRIHSLLTSDNNEKHILNENEIENFPQYTSVFDYLSNLGFQTDQIKLAFSHCISTNESYSIQYLNEECLQYLCLHLPEEELPAEFDPRGRTLDVIVSSSSNSNQYSKECDLLSSSYGIKKNQALDFFLFNLVAPQNITSEQTVFEAFDEVFWNVLIQLATKNDTNKMKLFDIESIDTLGTNDSFQEELEAIQAIFDQGFNLDKQKNKILITISLNEEFSLQILIKLKNDKVAYPDVFPMVFLRGSWDSHNKKNIGLKIHYQIAQFLITECSLGEPMLFELYNHVIMLLENNNDDFNEASLESSFSELLRSSKESKKKTTSDTKFVKKTNVTKIQPIISKREKVPHRPKDKSAFWSTLPHNTPEFNSNVSEEMTKARMKLPAHKARETLLRNLELISSHEYTNNRVLLLTGETGCGKSTQIPQYILEEYSSNAKIIVTQPRRLAATGVAYRVAEERGETEVGQGQVGYIVRGDVAISKYTRLIFCTTGVLLKQLQSENPLECITHLIIDECHERHVDTDLLLALIKHELLGQYPNLIVILMSATMDADKLANYFSDKSTIRQTKLPSMHIPGFTFPVQEYSLRHILKWTDYRPPITKKIKRKKQMNNQEEENIDIIEERLKQINPSNIDYNLIAFLVKKVVQFKLEENEYGSVLIFLPGAPEIYKAETSIKRIVSSLYSEEVHILLLHGGLDPKEQRKCFIRSRGRKIKVILSTNIAETSITIPDCTTVIDTCREKQSGFDISNRMPLLVETFTSYDSCKQRRGRAGRVCEGTYYSLLSDEMKQRNCPKHGIPEIQRCSLDQIVLSLQFLGVDGLTFLTKLMMDPPTVQSVSSSIRSLEKIGALDYIDQEDEAKVKLSPLGMHLACIPAPPVIGKLLVLGNLLGVRQATLAVAAVLTLGQTPLTKVMNFNNKSRNNANEKDDIELEKQKLKNEAILKERQNLFQQSGGGNSDLAFLANIYLKWSNASNYDKKDLCNVLGVIPGRLQDMKQLVNQYDSALSSLGFSSLKNTFSNETTVPWRLLRACIVGALSPNRTLRVVRPILKYQDTVEGAVEKDGIAKELKFFIRTEIDDGLTVESNADPKNYKSIPQERVFIHPSSMTFNVGSYSCPWLVYHDLVYTTKPFIRDSTECSSYALLLFGGKKLNVYASNEIIVIDNWIRLSANARIGVLIQGLRKKMNELLKAKFNHPDVDIVKNDVMMLITELILSDGHGL